MAGATSGLGERERVLRLLLDRSDRLRSSGVRRLRLFGSLARGEARADSDVDLMAELDSSADFSLLDHAALEVELEELIGRRVEITTAPGKMRAAVRERALRDAVEVF